MYRASIASMGISVGEEMLKDLALALKCFGPKVTQIAVILILLANYDMNSHV